ncbi:MAG: hypothetical protein JWQ74_3445 [Marmoricola sp.]|nr:hypothetical protein [Marmoricola sp.]
MARRDDEHWHDDPIVHALLAPGSDVELAREQEFLALYRAHRPRAAVRRRMSRFGLGSVAAAVTVALTAGVASAYGRVLPDPVQDFAHGVLGPVGVRAHQPEAREASVVAPTPRVTATPTVAPTAAPQPSVSPGRVVPSPATTSGTAGPAPTQTADPGITATAVAVPTQAPGAPSGGPRPVRAPSAVRISVGDRQVAVGGTAAVRGVVMAEDGSGVRRRMVQLFGRTTGGKWTRYAGARTAANGTVTLQTPALSETVNLQLRTAGKVRSAVVRVVVRPGLSAAVAQDSGTSTVTVAASGGQPGDLVTAYRRLGGRLVEVGSARLDASGTAVVVVPTPKRKTRITLILPATARHGRAETKTTLAAP